MKFKHQIQTLVWNAPDGDDGVFRLYEQIFCDGSIKGQS